MRLLAAASDPEALREALCSSAGLRKRLLGVLGASVAGAVVLAVVAATVAMARWWGRLPPGTAPP
ncbi:MAG: hypothetical protein KY464_14065, partial [Gemmatimonadetes bacterium]|nr:hypothetical protein [Gemmatimonadota bacterium]